MIRFDVVHDSLRIFTVFRKYVHYILKSKPNWVNLTQILICTLCVRESNILKILIFHHDTEILQNRMSQTWTNLQNKVFFWNKTKILRKVGRAVCCEDSNVH